MNIEVSGELCYVDEDIDYISECFEKHPEVSKWIMLLPRESLNNELFEE